MARKDRYDIQRNVKRKKRNRETEDKLVSTSEIRTLLFRAQRSEAESEFEKSENVIDSTQETDAATCNTGTVF